MAKNVVVKTIKGLAKKVDKANIKTIIFVKEDIEFDIEIKMYIPISDKRIIAELTVANSFVDDDGIKRVDPAIREVISNVMFIKYYTNINECEDIYEMYDIVKSTGILDKVKSSVPEGEMELLRGIIEDRIEEEYYKLEQENNFVNATKNFLDVMNSKMQEGIKEFENFNPEKLKNIMAMAQQFTGNVDGVDVLHGTVDGNVDVNEVNVFKSSDING